jgi:hypothetical protein
VFGRTAFGVTPIVAVVPFAERRLPALTHDARTERARFVLERVQVAAGSGVVDGLPRRGWRVGATSARATPLMVAIMRRRCRQFEVQQ